MHGYGHIITYVCNDMTLYIYTCMYDHRPNSAPLQSDRVRKMPSVKADLAIYSYVFGISSYCKIVGLMFSIKFLVQFGTIFAYPVTNYIKFNL